MAVSAAAAAAAAGLTVAGAAMKGRAPGMKELIPSMHNRFAKGRTP